MPQAQRAHTTPPTRSTGRGHATREQAAPAREIETPPEHANGGLRIPVPYLGVPHVSVAHVPVPHVGAPHLPHLGSTSGRVLWLGGLAGVAVAGIIDWPVAVAIAAGTYIAEQRARAHPSSTSKDVPASA